MYRKLIPFRLGKLCKLPAGKAFYLLLILLILPVMAQAQSLPSAFYTDLDSGPATGGQNGKGAFVTVYGSRFGATQGSSTVTIGGQPADNYPVWSDSRITFQLGTAATSGNIVVNVAGLGSSNGIPFTVRSGNIYFISPTGSDTANGSYATPWKTIPHAAGAMVAGDISYAMNGTDQTTLSNYTASLAIASSGAAGKPIALVTYPGAQVTIGSATGPEYGIRTPAISGAPFSYWTIAGFIIRGGNQGLKLVQAPYWRVIGNDFSCPNGGGASACVEITETSDYSKFYGNTIHDSGTGSTKLYHSLYYSTDTNHDDVGWNTIANNKTCRGIQFHSSPLGSSTTTGLNMYDISVHDNVVHGQICDGINFATIDPSKGQVVAYNNVVYSVGLGPDPPDGTSSYACIASPGITNNGSPGSGTAQMYNNTLYDCGARGGSNAGAFAVSSGSPAFNLTDNLVLLKSGESYISSGSQSSKLGGSNNLWFGSGSAPAGFSASVSADPLLASPGTNFMLTSGSPAIDAGVNTPAATDITGNPRPLGAAYDIGAYEYGTGQSTQVKPAAPISLTGTVN
ncbi:MAG: choice-of-anchor Q domain-containing protein [Acidobacteriaceae bacterium]